MVNKTYVPSRGDIVWINFDPTLGHEQRGRRPALVLSPQKYNKMSVRAICCPITSKEKGYIFEVTFTGKKIKGAILTDQLQTLDFHERNMEFIEKMPKGSFDAVDERVSALLFE